MYSEKVIEHFKNPHNQGSISDADSIGEKGNPNCGDVMKIYLKIKENEGDKKQSVISDIKFETLGCAAAIAVSSSVTELAMGMTLEEALNIDKDKVITDLGGLPTLKIHCSMLGVEALHEAIEKYLSK